MKGKGGKGKGLVGDGDGARQPRDQETKDGCGVELSPLLLKRRCYDLIPLTDKTIVIHITSISAMRYMIGSKPPQSSVYGQSMAILFLGIAGRFSPCCPESVRGSRGTVP